VAASPHAEPRVFASRLSALISRPLSRELLVFIAFFLLTAALTWPWVIHLRNACADPGDPYLHSWVMWWDFHQTFHDPIHLFDGNIFYPLRWTLAFTEDDYGIALLFFPLYAFGLRPLTVNSVATFFGFVFSGYAAFRLTRTLTGSTAAAWVAGVTFAFTPYRFHVLSQITYVFAGWMALLLEALVLFARKRTRKRAAWLAAAFTMNALSSLTWMTLSLVPLVLSALVLIVRRDLWRERDFWRRGAAAAAASLLVLLPFLLPYLYVSKLYGFSWPREMVDSRSPMLSNWMVAEYRTRLWNGFGENLFDGGARLFPGLLPLLLALASVLIVEPFRRRAAENSEEACGARSSKWVARLDALSVAAGAFALVSVGWANSTAHPLLGRIFAGPTTDRALLVLTLALAARLSIAYPHVLRRLTGASNLFENIRVSRRGEAFWIAAVWAVTGFLMSLGTNSWLYRVLFDLVFFFHSMREPSRAAMVACLGLSVLAGIGAKGFAHAVARRRPRTLLAPAVVALVVLALLFELNAAPMSLTYGAVDPDAITLRLKDTPMRGGLVELPTGGGVLPHLYMLRAADHGRPLVNAVSTFVPPHAFEIENLSRARPISPRLLDALEKVPTSYLVIHNSLIEPERRADYDSFLASGLISGRLRFIRRYGEGEDLYAVVKTEPQAHSEGALPFDLSIKEWGAQIEDDPANIIGQYTAWGQALFRMNVAAFGEMPRYADFMRDVRVLGRGVVPDFYEQDKRLEGNLRALAEDFTTRPSFKKIYDPLDDARYVDRLAANTGADIGDEDRAALKDALVSGSETRAGVLLKIVENSNFVEKEQNRSLVALHYFAFFRRNPDDPPDRNLDGLRHWVSDLETSHNPAKLTAAFKDSIEYSEMKRGRK